MVDIKLDADGGSYQSGIHKVTVTKKDHEKDSSFERVEYRITYNEQFLTWKASLWSSSSYDVYIIPKKGQSHIFKYITKESDHIVKRVESYHSKRNTNFPLVIGFKRDKPPDFRYYSFTHLTRTGYYTGFPKGENYGPDDLERILKEENNKVNKIKYTSENVRSQICKKEDEDAYFPITKLHYSLDQKNRYGLNVLTKEMLFRQEKDKDINTSFIEDRYFYDISIYYHRYEFTLFVEFTDDSDRKLQYLRRDADGYYWTEYSIPHGDSSFSMQLQTRNKEFYSNITYMLEKSNGQYGAKNITVTPEPQLPNEYTMYTHKTNTIDSITKTFVLYNRRPITLVDNDKFRGGGKLRPDTIQNSKFKEISTYSLSTSQNEHLLIKLTKDTKTHYYLKRSSEDGSKWKQVSIEEIKEHPFFAASGEGGIKDQSLETLLEDYKKTKKLLEWISLQLKGSFVILLNKKDREEYTDKDIEEALGTLESKKDFNAFKLNGKKIAVSDKTSDDGQCIHQYCYKVLVHDLDQVTKETPEFLALSFLIPSSKEKTKYKQLKLFSNSAGTGKQDYLSYQKSQNKVYVVFYGDNTGGNQGDPRPLLLCYGGQTYKPKGKDEYDQTWVKVTGVTKCLCVEGGDEANQALLEAVTGVVGFLNRVQLEVHPGGTSKDQQCQAGDTSGVSGATNTCTYPVHTYNGSDIKVRVTCEPVPSKGPQTGSKTCYKKLTHQPIGTSERVNTGFRLGDVEYCPNGGSSSRTGSIKYYQNGTDSGQNGNNVSLYKYNPLVAVWAYFYNADTGYQDPLLVVLEFAKNGAGDTQNDKECYKLTKSDSGEGLQWQKDVEAKEFVDTGGSELASYLDGIRYSLKQVVQIEIHRSQRSGYKLMGKITNELSTGKGSTPINESGDDQISVQEFRECEQLTGAGFECFQHKLKSISEKTQYQIGGLQLFMPQKLPKQTASSSSTPDQEISLYKIRKNQETEVKKIIKESKDTDEVYSKISSMLTEYKSIYYTFCMGDFYVYFKNGDPRPLLMCFNGMAYRPLKLPKLNEENYIYSGDDYKKWVRVPQITSCPCTDEDDLISVLKEVESIQNGDNTVTIATSTTVTLGLAGGGTGLVVYKYSDFFLSLIGKVLTKGAT